MKSENKGIIIELSDFCEYKRRIFIMARKVVLAGACRTAIAYFAKLPVNTIGSVYGKLNSAFPSFHVPSITMNLIQQMISEQM